MYICVCKPPFPNAAASAGRSHHHTQVVPNKARGSFRVYRAGRSQVSAQVSAQVVRNKDRRSFGVYRAGHSQVSAQVSVEFTCLNLDVSVEFSAAMRNLAIYIYIYIYISHIYTYLYIYIYTYILFCIICCYFWVAFLGGVLHTCIVPSILGLSSGLTPH